MESESLVRMANRIGDFFESFPDREEALDGIANHIRKFWEPRMRTQLLAAIDAGDSGLRPEVLEAIARHRAMLTPARPVPTA
ncbi:formate dehydrogenase subunit delta [Ramlibacter sp. G-1-2-2]|uniref:Formate dehydrogenase subunit delta n=1 Tax=Ramlibacter agri TaxID=2728837 RepID=A0A848H830_9BURK|nr:formate dehydrogenase subunit delta [Ramlibacter agri]NML46627.1 formate dehydrogenase subunit delta [Ramlibacter agri]